MFDDGISTRKGYYAASTSKAKSVVVVVVVVRHKGVGRGYSSTCRTQRWSGNKNKTKPAYGKNPKTRTFNVNGNTNAFQMQKLHNRRGKPGFLSPFRSYDYFSLFLRDQTEIVHGQFSLQKKKSRIFSLFFLAE